MQGCIRNVPTYLDERGAPRTPESSTRYHYEFIGFGRIVGHGPRAKCGTRRFKCCHFQDRVTSFERAAASSRTRRRETRSATEPRTNRPTLPLNRFLSIFVSDVDTVSQIKFSEVMDKLVSQSGDPLLSKQLLFHQWWDSAGQRPGLGLGPHCDDDAAPMPASGVPTFTSLSTLNSFPYRCPRLELNEASSDPFTNEVETNPNAYSAIAFSNRFDLVSPPNDCGQYRIVFGRNSGKSHPLNRNLIIFEARVPNPKPADGLNGCRPILEFWHGLSDETINAVERGKRLHDFYLDGLPASNVGPIVDVAHYALGTGQIRSNQFMLNNKDVRLSTPPFDWTLREPSSTTGL
jgi:hypothetical protein